MDNLIREHGSEITLMTLNVGYVAPATVYFVVEQSWILGAMFLGNSEPHAHIPHISRFLLC